MIKVKDIIDLPYGTSKIVFVSSYSGRRIAVRYSTGYITQKHKTRIEQILDLEVVAIDAKAEILNDEQSTFTYVKCAVSNYRVDGKIF